MPKCSSPKLKFQVVLELLQVEKTAGQVAKALTGGFSQYFVQKLQVYEESIFPRG